MNDRTPRRSGSQALVHARPRVSALVSNPGLSNTWTFSRWSAKPRHVEGAGTALTPRTSKGCHQVVGGLQLSLQNRQRQWLLGSGRDKRHLVTTHPTALARADQYQSAGSSWPALTSTNLYTGTPVQSVRLKTSRSLASFRTSTLEMDKGTCGLHTVGGTEGRTK
jgi:hypothetical protein